MTNKNDCSCKMDPIRILVVEDDLTFSKQLTELLKKQGFDVEFCNDGQQGLLSAIQGHFDLILLDVLLPELNGFTVLNRIRQVKQTPVMMLTACGAEEERIEGYSKGADDYLPKPFNFTELLLRIDALLRRTRNKYETGTNDKQLQVDQLILDRREQTVHYDNQQVSLTPIQFRLLWVLVNNAGESLSKPFLYQVVLEKVFSRYDRSLDMHLSRIRKKLVEVGMSAERLMTVHGKGYRFQ